MNLQRLGSEYGGWTVDLDRIPQGSVVVDAGVGMDISFAESLAEIKWTRTVFVDPGEESERYVRQRNVPQAIFLRMAIDVRRGVRSLYKHRTGGSDSLLRENANSGDVTHQVETVDLRSLLAAVGPVALLKLDIEGSEYDVYRDCLGVPQVAIEFHHRLIAGRSEDDTNRVVECFERNGYEVIHRGEHEITFALRADA